MTNEELNELRNELSATGMLLSARSHILRAIDPLSSYYTPISQIEWMAVLAAADLLLELAIATEVR